MRYRIGEMAEFFGMTKEGVRFLERQGVIRSQRDEKNGYRYYPRGEITRLKQIRSYRALGFSLDEAQRMVYETPRSQVLERLDEKLAELEEKEVQLQLMKRLLRRQREVARRLIEDAGCELMTRPEMIFLPLVGDEDSGKEGRESLAQARAVEKAWTQAMPPVILCSLRNAEDEGRTANLYGSIAVAQEAEAMGLPVPPWATRLPACTCVAGTVEARLGVPLDTSPLFAFAAEHSLVPCGDIYAIMCMTCVGENGERYGLHKVYLPVREEQG